MKKMVFTATLAVLLTANVKADTVGLYLGGQIWQSEASGILGEKNTPINANLKKEQQTNYFVAIEHPFPLLPNLRISNTTLDSTGNNTSTQEYNDDNETSHVNVNVDVNIDASFDVSYIDYTLYYELFDNGLFSFDLGLTARDFKVADTVTETTTTITTSRYKEWDEEEHEGHDHPALIDTTNTVTTRKIKADEIMPLLYVATNINLALTGLSVFAQGDYLLKGDHSLYNYQVGLSYDIVDNKMIDFNLTLGYRAVKMELENLDSLYTNLDFKGAFVGVIAHF